MLYDLDALTGDTLTVKAGGKEHVVVLPTAIEELEWARLVRRFASGDYDEDTLEGAVELVAKWVPTIDADNLGGRALIRLGTWLTTGGEMGNASGAAGQQTSPPSSPTTTRKTRAKS